MSESQSRSESPSTSEGKLRGLGGFWAVVVGLLGIDRRDVDGWPEAMGPALLLAVAFANALVSLGTFYLASGVFFPQLGIRERVGVGIVGGLVIGFIDWIVVSTHPNLPRWFVACFEPSEVVPRWWTRFRRQTSDSDGWIIPPMPGGGARFCQYLPRFLLTAVIAAVVGTGVIVAANQDVVESQRVILATEATQHKWNEEDDVLRTAHGKAVTATQTWQNQRTVLVGQVESQQKVVTDLMNRKSNAEHRIKCESGELTCPGITPNGGEGLARARADAAALAIQLAAASADLQNRQAAVEAHMKAQPQVPQVPAPRVATQDDLDPHYLQGLNVTIAALSAAEKAGNWPWWQIWGAHGFIFVFDIVPVLFKLLMGYPAYERRSWIRRSLEVRNTLAAARIAKTHHGVALLSLKNAGAEKVSAASEVAEIDRQAAKDAAQARATENIAMARQIAALDREAAVAAGKDVAAHRAESAREIAEINREADVAAGKDVAAHRAESAREIAEINRQAAKQAAQAMAIQTVRAASSRSTYKEKQSAWNKRGGGAESVSNDERHPAHSDGEQPSPDHTAEYSEASAKQTRASRDERFPPWNQDVWDPNTWDLEVDGERMKVGRSLLPINKHGGYARSEVFIAFCPPNKNHEKVITPERLPEVSRAVKMRRSKTRVAEWNRMVDNQRNLAALLDGRANGMRITTDAVVTPYRPRSDMLRYLGQLKAEKKELKYGNVALWGCQVAETLALLHERGWVHNDIKPQNILMDGSMQIGRSPRLAGDDLSRTAILIDFDAAALLNPPQPRREKLAMTKSWAAPEAREGTCIATTGADVFGLSAVLLFAMSGKCINRFVERSQPDERVPWVERYHEAYGMLPELLADCPRRLADVVLTGLNPDPGSRPTAQNLQDKLYECAQDPEVKKVRGFEPPLQGLDVKYRSTGFTSEDLELLKKIGWIVRMENTR